MRVATVLAVVCVVIAGCAGSTGTDATPSVTTDPARSTTDTTDSPAMSPKPTATETSTDRPTLQKTESLTSVVYTSSDENTSLRIKVDKLSGTYTLRVESYLSDSMYGESGFFTKRNATDIVLSLNCDILHGLAYNYTEYVASWDGSPENVSGDTYTRETNTGEKETVDSPLKRIFTEYEPRSVTVVVYDRDRTKQFGRCSIPSEGTIKKEIYVD